MRNKRERKQDRIHGKTVADSWARGSDAKTARNSKMLRTAGRPLGPTDGRTRQGVEWRVTVGFMKRSFSKKTKCFNLLFFAQINLISVVDGLESKNIQL